MTDKRKMTERGKRRNAALESHAAPTREDRLHVLAEMIGGLVADAAAPEWTWIRWSHWARSPEHARRIAEREGIAITRIGRDLFGARADLDALAERNRVVVGAANDSDDEINPRVLAAFGGGR